MAVFRIEKTRDYMVMSNHHLRDTEHPDTENPDMDVLDMGNPAQLNNV